MTMPTRATAFVFALKAKGLQVRRLWRDGASPPPRLPQGEPGDYPHLVAESVTPLWNETTHAERGLQRGKVQNLRVALRGLEGRVLPAGAIFSFWRNVGRATRGRGFVAGRQVSEGCLVPAVGGGLCQLSNALYDVARKANLEIVERHPHTVTVPGSVAQSGHDATVFWNYIDLRFASPRPLLLTVRLTENTLVVRLWGQAPPAPAPPALIALSARTPRRVLVAADHSCVSCGEVSCFRHALPAPGDGADKTAYLVDTIRPEWQAYLTAQRQPADSLMLPFDGSRWNRPPYAWDTDGYDRTVAATVPTLKRAWQSRRLAGQGAARQTARLAASADLAGFYAHHLRYDTTRLCVDQSLLPFLWRDGHLGGRHYSVLMTRPPLAVLHETLDRAASLHPESPTLSDFRAPDWVVDAEREALTGAAEIVTTNPSIAALFPGRAVLLAPLLPPATPTQRGPHVIFPGPTLGRKGAYEMREAARALGLTVSTPPRTFEGADFWQGIATRPLAAGQSAWDGARVVVQPAWVEDNPRHLLSAIAAGVPVIATPACGVGGLPGVTEVAAGDTGALIACLRDALL